MKIKVWFVLTLLVHLATAVPVLVYPELDLQEFIELHQEETHFILQEGTFTSSKPITPKRGSIIEGVKGATINQSVHITEENVKLSNIHISSPYADCTTIEKPTTLSKVNIGPCTGNGIHISNTESVYLYDSYIHPEYPTTGCCDSADGIFIQNSKVIHIQGNVIAYGESNIEMGGSSEITIYGNFFLNPLGPSPRGQHVQAWSGCSNITVQKNYAISSTDTTTYKFKADQEDAINFGVTTGILATDNWVTGGKSASGCGIIADDQASDAHFLNNVLYETGQCGVGIANGVGHVIDSNVIYNTPIPSGGNTAIYVWQQYKSPCSTVVVSNNIGYATNSQGQPNSYWNGGGCDPVTLQNNTFDTNALKILTPFLQKYPPPTQVPPVPLSCTAVSPYSHASKTPSC
jgi:hypothetical protein